MLLHRFRDNPFVTQVPYVRAFAGAPLVASNGHRLGTLSFMNPAPRIFTAEEMVILVNMAGTAASHRSCLVHRVLPYVKEAVCQGCRTATLRTVVHDFLEL